MLEEDLDPAFPSKLRLSIARLSNSNVEPDGAHSFPLAASPRVRSVYAALSETRAA
jgi:hypothetical protein